MKYLGIIVGALVMLAVSVTLFVFAHKNKEDENKEKAMVVGGIFSLALSLGIVFYLLNLYVEGML